MNYHQYSPEMTMTKKREKERKNLSGTLTKPEKSTMIKKTHQSGSEKKTIKKKGKEMNKTDLKPMKPPKPALVAGEDPIQLTPDQSHRIFLSSIKTATRSCLQWELGLCQTKTTGRTLITIANYVTSNATEGYLHDEDEIWQMANAKVESALPSEILEIKNNSPEPTDIVLVLNPDAFINLENSPKEFHEHYQNLALTKEEQEQCLEEINTQLCDHCLIPCDFQFCDNCDLIYNLPPYMIYTILEEEKPISSCASKSELPFNPDSNSDNNDDENTEIYIVLFDLTKEQILKWFSNNEKGIMPEHTYDTDAGFDLRYPEKDAIKLEPYLHICIDLKIALEIPATTMVQLAFRSSLVKREINIRKGIIDVEYVGNIIAMLQNNLEKAYIIKPNEKIAQAIFLPLVKIAQLVLMKKREELEITAREIQGFRSTDRIDIPVNMAEEKIIGQEEIISTGQVISIPPYDQYMIIIERKVKDKDQIFEAETSLCKSREIGLINLHIPAKNHNHIKIPIYNTTGDAITIPEGIFIGYINTKLENQPPSIIPDFLQLCEYVNITSQTIYRQKKCYLLQSKQLEQMNMENLDPLQHMQLKILLNNFNDIFTSENEFGRTDIIQHQIKTGDAMPIKQ
ncbi:hypothetical protein G9A89_018955 [Geosiphon pyriformis]|nr:hypothetical protein G9A89_018955 [Geosiphon pyriformis]